MTLSLFMIFIIGVIGIFISGGNAASGLLIAAIIAAVLAPFISLAYSIRCGLLKKRRWAWIAGIILFTAQIPTAWLPFGVAGLWGLLHPGTRAAFRAEAVEREHFDADEYIAIISAILSFIVILTLLGWVSYRINARKKLTQVLLDRPTYQLSNSSCHVQTVIDRLL